MTNSDGGGDGEGRGDLPANFSGTCTHIGLRGHVNVGITEASINADEQVEVGVVDVVLVSARRRHVNHAGAA